MTMTRDHFGSVWGYTIYQIGLHWLIAAMVFAQLFFGKSITEAIEAAKEGEAVAGSEALLAGMQ